MNYHVDTVHKVITVDGDGSNLSKVEARVVNQYVKDGYSIIRKDSKTPLMLPQKSSAKESSFDMYHKYEVVFSMRSNPDCEFSRKMIARIICPTPEKLREYLASSYVRVHKVWPVGKKRGEYLKNKGAEFHTLEV